VNLPAEIREMITAGDTAAVPKRYREYIQAYQQWLPDHARAAAPR
jgi:hypothetical protein